MNGWFGDISLENSGEIVKMIWDVTKGLPCVLVETVEGLVEPTLVIPVLWLTDIAIRETTKKEDFEDGFDGFNISTSYGMFEYPRYGHREPGGITTHVVISQKWFSFTFWNKKGKRVVHTFTIHS